VLLAAGAAIGGYFGIREVARLATPQTSSQGLQEEAIIATGGGANSSCADRLRA
jgi:hypothetical protein